ncbi:MAG: malto-oligosyltrehalose synthase, partial [Planctomycetes bacterium]|nr:malto-oligosyltrehalose synthase [Planctomycetota bacterium]
MSARGAAGGRIPIATYRLQLNRHFTLRDATLLVEDLAELGVTDVYLSPIFRARAGSLHGYDVVDHATINPELGGAAALGELSDALRGRGMGLIVDVIPNHMCIDDGGNRWWNDVLENGPASAFAPHFDIDWRPPKVELADRVLLPILGDQFGRVLESQELQVAYQAGTFVLRYYERALPLAPKSLPILLRPVAAALERRLGPAAAEVLEMESVLTAIDHLPDRHEGDPRRLKERGREKEVIKRRLAALVEGSADVRSILDRTVREANGAQGAPRSFDRLEKLLDQQAYRLSDWRVAADEINYRRFFDVNSLAAIRMEDPRVFTAVHDLLFRLIRDGCVTGLRIDHVDGLYDPEAYLDALQRRCREALAELEPAPKGEGMPALVAGPLTLRDPERPFWIVTEKILGREERLCLRWPTCGTTGYEFLALVDGLFVDAA